LKKAFLIVFVVLLIDQTLKFWIKTHLALGEEINVFGNWFIIHFTENPGMAFGMQFAGNYGKLMLSIFRLIAIGGIGYYLYVITRREVNFWLVFSLSLVLAGAAGNMIDSAVYGLFFNESTFFEVARFMPQGGGYGTFLHGKVVDMLYFPILQGFYPQWVPFVGGEEFIFFRPVFNIADSSISIGVLMMIIFQKQFFHPAKSPDMAETDEATQQQ